MENSLQEALIGAGLAPPAKKTQRIGHCCGRGCDSCETMNHPYPKPERPTYPHYEPTERDLDV